MKLGIEQLQVVLDAFLAQPEGASYRCVQEPYEDFLRTMAPSQAELDAQRAHPPLCSPLFTLVLMGGWNSAAWERTLSSLTSQTYRRFDITLDAARFQGDYILYLWPGDLLSPDALYRFAKAAEEGADLVYCDEDIRGPGEKEERTEPFFKSAPSRITQMSYDMLSCGVAVKRELFHMAGRMRGDTPEERYAYNLRCLRSCRKAVHIPRPLYTLATDRRPGAGALYSVEPPLIRSETASAGQWRGSLRVEWMQKKQPAAAIIIPNLNNAPALRRLLESIEAQTLYPYSRILIADRGSRDGQTLRYYRLLEKNRGARIVAGMQDSLSKTLNRAAMAANAEVLVFLGRDTEIIAPNWLESLLNQLYRPGVGAVGGKLVDALGRISFCGGVGGLEGWAGSFYAGSPDILSSLRQNRFVNSIRAVSVLSLWCMALRASVFWDAGGFDERLDQGGLDVDLCLRLGRRSQACVYTPYTLVRCHTPLPSLADAPPWDQRRCYEALWNALLCGDPHCSPHYDLSKPVPLAAAQPQPALALNPLYHA